MSQKFILRVNEKCEGCGICYAKYPSYFIELEDGTAKSQESTYCFSEQQLESILKDCPSNAIVFESVSNNVKQMFVLELEKLQSYRVQHSKTKEFKFKKEEYNISIPSASGERRYEYSSYEAAERAAEREINNKMYA